MPELKLSRLPDRTPIKLTIQMLPDLHQALTEYAQIYATTYDQEEPLSDLIPAMLAAFLASDRTFARGRERSARAKGP
jgi:hypothetical protein